MDIDIICYKLLLTIYNSLEWIHNQIEFLKEVGCQSPIERTVNTILWETDVGNKSYLLF
jgi:hypothetical protein